jgi:hypothetical protein
MHSHSDGSQEHSGTCLSLGCRWNCWVQRTVRVHFELRLQNNDYFIEHMHTLFMRAPIASASLPTLSIISLFHIGSSSECAKRLHCGFNLHFYVCQQENR